MNQEPQLHRVFCADRSGGHRMAYWQWGDDASAHVVVCVHGLSRQGRDFDVLVRALLKRAPYPIRVVCPDVAGRGQSDYLQNPADYQIQTYAADILALLQQLQHTAPISNLDWIGTSMGGLIGMLLWGADQPPLSLRKLVLNDVGPVLSWPALTRIGQYLGQSASFVTLQQAADALWASSQSFGPHTPEQWLELSRHMVKPLPQGGWTLHYDLALAQPFLSLTQQVVQQSEALLWQLYDRISAPTLLLRGAQSDLLSAETAQTMTQRGPKAQLVQFEGVGHAPTLVAPDQIDTVTHFLFPQ